MRALGVALATEGFEGATAAGRYRYDHLPACRGGTAADAGGESAGASVGESADAVHGAAAGAPSKAMDEASSGAAVGKSDLP